MTSGTQRVHFYADETGKYQIDKLFAWVNENTQQHQNLSISILLEHIAHNVWKNLRELQQTKFKAIFESQEHRNRMMEVDLQYPIILLNNHRLIDGIYRIFRAIFENKPMIKVIFIDQSRLLTICIDPPKSVKPSHVPGVSFPDRYISLPKTALPANSHERRDLLEEYFPDLLPSVKETDSGYELCLERPSSPYECYLHDEHLRQGLKWWREGTRVRDIPKEYHLFKGGIFALEEQWVPLSWSHAFTKLGQIPKELVLLHLDDHRDMMVPRLGRRLDGSLVDYMTGDKVDFLNPESISKAISSGGIGKGSIVTPLVWSVPKIHIRHLSFRPQTQTTHHLDRVTSADNILFKSENRIGLQFQDTNWDNLPTKSNYVVSADIATWLRQIPQDVPILLHFDLDYFNNRFDGSSDWKQGHTRSHELEFAKQLQYLKDIFTALKSHNLIKSIIDTSIGISPGFYPAEFWEQMTLSLKKEAHDVGLVLDLSQGEKK